MAIVPKPILIVGCGPGSPDFITPAAVRAAQTADVLIGFPRLLDLFPGCGQERVIAEGPITPLLDQLACLHHAGRQVVVLVSGDAGLYSLARNVVACLGRDNCRIIPAVSSVQVAFARLGLEWADARILSAHGRVPTASAEELRCAERIAILAGTPDAIRWAASVAAALQGTHWVFLCENLTMPDENVRPMTSHELQNCTASSLAIVVLARKELLE